MSRRGNELDQAVWNLCDLKGLLGKRSGIQAVCGLLNFDRLPQKTIKAIHALSSEVEERIRDHERDKP